MTIVLKSVVALPPDDVVPFGEKDGDGIKVRLWIPFACSLPSHIVDKALQTENGTHQIFIN